MRSVNGLGILLTLGFWGFVVWYFQLSGSWNPLEGRFGWFGAPNFVRNFAILAPLYLCLGALFVAASMTMSASTRGRLAMLGNVASSLLMLVYCIFLYNNAVAWGVAADRVGHINYVLYLSVLDVCTVIGIALLVSLAHRTFGIGN